MRYLIGACLLAGCAGSSNATPAARPGPATAGQPTPLTVTASGTSHGPTTEAAITRRVEDALKEIPIGAQVPRIAFVDVAFPRSGPEFTALGGFAAVLVCAFARDGRELPPERVVARTGTASADLPLAARQEKQIPAGAVADVFGARRVDSVYLLPVFATVVDTTITVHFRVSARALDALRFPLPENEGHIPAGVDLAAPVRDPQADALEKLIREELPLMGPNTLLSP